MKWRVYKIGKAKLALAEKRSLHTCNSRDPKLPATYIVGTYNVFYWDGVEKWKQIISL